MNKEKLPKHYRKPDLNLICPPKFYQHIAPQLILSQTYKQYHELPDCDIQKSNQKLYNKKMAATTYMDWFVPTQKDYQGRRQQINSRRQTNNVKNQGHQRKTQSFFKRKKNSDVRNIFCKNSPYVKNKQQYERIISSLKPVKGPTDSLIKQIKRHNQINKKNTQNVLLASKESFKQKIMKYSSRIGLGKNEKIFIMNSKDAHIRQALMRNGWIQCEDLSSTFFHLKWVYNDCPADYLKLQQGQFYNHFKNNQQLTNKNLFRKNIRKSQPYLQPNYPQTFDLQANQDLLRFQLQYIKFQYYNFLEKLCKFLTDNTRFESYIRKVMSLNSPDTRFGWNFVVDKSQQRDFIKLMTPKRLQAQQFNQLIQIREILYAFCFAISQFIDQTSNSKRKRHQRKLSIINFSNQINSILKLLKNNFFNLNSSNSWLWSQQNKSFNKNQSQCYPISKSGTAQLKRSKEKRNNVRQDLQKIFQYDKFLLIFVVFLYERFKQRFQKSFGTQNWWIIKPAGVSRGTGIKIQSQLSRIVQNKYGKIVQKYIQKPLLLQCGRKFDIRQWVLVKSFLPLKAYIFQNCYCRFSANKYNMNNLQTLSVHLTNYSQQKVQFQKKGFLKQNSIMSQQELRQQIDRKTWQGHWDYIKAEINEQIVKSLKCCQYQIQDKKQSFEVFGFDIILDVNYKPWVLEVNLSPACERRAQFLGHYLDKMAQGIIDLLQDRPIRNWNILQVTPQQKYKSYSKIHSLEHKQNCVIKIQRFYRKFIKNKRTSPKEECEQYRQQFENSQNQQLFQIKHFEALQ